ncbi:MAG: helix-turn-helix transcriptional regulator [bacterium]
MIGERLKKLRMNAKLTQKDVADIMNVTPQTISKWELDLSEPNMDMLKELSALYGVKVDDLLDPYKTTPYENQSNYKVKEISLYLMYVILLGLSITIAFVPYITADIYVLEYGILDNSLPEWREIIPFEMQMTSIFVLSMMMGLPVVVFTLHLIDRKLISHIVISFIALAINLSYLVPIIASPLFLNPEIGMILHIVYIFFLIAMLLITISIQRWHIYMHIQNHPKTWIGFAGMILTTFIFPFSFYEVGHHYYFSQFEVILFGVMIVLSGLLMFKDIKKLQTPILALSFMLIFGLIYGVVVYIFNSGLIVGSLNLFGYMLFLGLSLSEIKGDKLPLKEIFKLRLLPFEIITIAIYIYVFLSGGDLFFYYDPTHVNPAEFIHFYNLPLHIVFYASLIALGAGLVFRWMKVKGAYVAFYVIWFGAQIYYAFVLYNAFFGENWRMTDGMFLFFPIILGITYIALFTSSKILIRVRQHKLKNIVT